MVSKQFQLHATWPAEMRGAEAKFHAVQPGAAGGDGEQLFDLLGEDTLAPQAGAEAGVVELAATVCPTSTFLDTTVPSTGDMIFV